MLYHFASTEGHGRVVGHTEIGSPLVALRGRTGLRTASRLQALIVGIHWLGRGQPDPINFVRKWLDANASEQKKRADVSYNEGKNGAFDEAVEISHKFGCLTWLDASSLKSDQLQYPTTIFIRLTGQERYFRGVLLAIASAATLEIDFVQGELNHRPSAWRKKNATPQPKRDFQSVLFMSCLEEVPRPPEIVDLAPPQHPTYVNL